MINLTNIARKIYSRRIKKIEKYNTQAEEIQKKVLEKLISKAKDTEYGKQHAFAEISSYSSYINNVPVNGYDDLKEYIDRMRHGEKDVLWKGKVKWYAKSSGTTNDKSKFIPVSKQGLKNIHYKGGTDTVVVYMRNNPQSKMFTGKGLILGGSHAHNYNVKSSLVGDLSAILIENINPIINAFRVPKKETALLSDFEEKREKIAHEVMNQNVTNLSGVPSWMMSVLVRVLELTGKKTLDEVWPNLEVFFHGGISFTPYRSQYENIIKSKKMHYMETYNASEGFFGIQDDPEDTSLLLMIDYGIFYEFCPMEAMNDDGTVADASKIVPLWEVEENKNYAMIISTSCGLWRYLIGDTIRFTKKNPYKFIISGRTKSFINAFGEELIVDNADKGIDFACKQTGAEILDYTAAPVFMGDDAKCRHQWIIEFKKKPEDIEEFTRLLDTKLQQLNSDYEAKRFKNITLQQLEIVEAREGLFNKWLKNKNKLGGQHKIPRLSNNRKIIEELLELNKKS